MKRIRQEVLAPDVDIRVEQITPVVSQIDGKNGEYQSRPRQQSFELISIYGVVVSCHAGFGFVSAALGMDSCIEMAATYGIGMCSIKHSNHFGMSASFVLQAARRGMMSLVFTNSSPAVSREARSIGDWQLIGVFRKLPAWGGMSRLMGVSPIACGAPGDEQGSGHFCLDMAPSVAARGKVYKALRRGEQIPSDWALDGEVSLIIELGVQIGDKAPESTLFSGSVRENLRRTPLPPLTVLCFRWEGQKGVRWPS